MREDDHHLSRSLSLKPIFLSVSTASGTLFDRESGVCVVREQELEAKSNESQYMAKALGHPNRMFVALSKPL
jgi:hypothetical protein